MLTRWNDFGLPDLDRGFSALQDLRHEMDRLFRRYEGPWLADFPAAQSPALGMPQIEMVDAGDELRVHAEVPGFRAEDLNVTLEQSSLTIRGERRADAPEGYSVHRKERSSLRFARSFTLPARVEADRVEAKLRDGILELRLPKVASERPRTITVKAA